VWLKVNFDVLVDRPKFKESLELWPDAATVNGAEPMRVLPNGVWLFWWCARRARRISSSLSSSSGLIASSVFSPLAPEPEDQQAKGTAVRSGACWFTWNMRFAIKSWFAACLASLQGCCKAHLSMLAQGWSERRS